MHELFGRVNMISMRVDITVSGFGKYRYMTQYCILK